MGYSEKNSEGFPISRAATIGEVSDGFHTLNAQDEHRHRLFLALMSTCTHRAWFSKLHHDGEMPFGEDWFIAGIELPSGQVSYHLPMHLWECARLTNARELPVGIEWDGHTSNDVLKRLREFATRVPPL